MNCILAIVFAITLKGFDIGNVIVIYSKANGMLVHGYKILRHR
jgi:hypothetical protein